MWKHKLEQHSHICSFCIIALHHKGSASVKMLWVCCWAVFDPWQFPVNDKQLFGSHRSTNNRSQATSSAGSSQLRTPNLREISIISEWVQYGGVQQLVPERDECSRDRVPTSRSKCRHQCAKDLAERYCAIIQRTKTF